MKKSVFIGIIMVSIFVFSSCEKDDEVPAISKTVLKSFGPDFAIVQSRLYLTGDSPIKRSGACWVLKSILTDDENAVEFATINDFVQEQKISEPGVFNMRVTGLDADTAYYVRFFAENGQGITYSYPVRVRTTKIYDDKIFVENGSFQMGNGDGNVNEMPVHEVKIERSYYLSKQEVTNAEYCKFLNKNDINKDGTFGEHLYIDLKAENVGIEHNETSFIPKAGFENKPVCFVSWFGANAYCEANGGRLPYESEWEYAAKGGVNLDDFSFAGNDNAQEVAWFNEPEIKPGGEKKSNSLGFFDLSGNAAEWCSDWYDATYYEKSPSINPLGPGSGTEKVIRGGDFSSGPVTVSARQSKTPDTCSPYIGFRMCIKL